MNHSEQTEAVRQRTLEAYRVLDTLPEQVYDDIARLAGRLCDTPIALISLIDRDRQWFKARVGLDAAQTPREYAFCDHAIRDANALLEVHDATLDVRFTNNPLVTGQPGIRFYAGMPLVAPNGAALGTVCVIDDKPRTLSEEQKSDLAALSRLVMRLLEHRSRDLVDRRAQLKASHVPTGTGKTYGVAIVQCVANCEELSPGIEQALRDCLAPEDVLGPHGEGEYVVVIDDAARIPALSQHLRAAVSAMFAGDVRIGFAVANTSDEPMEDVFLRAEEDLAGTTARAA